MCTRHGSGLALRTQVTPSVTAWTIRSLPAGGGASRPIPPGPCCPSPADLLRAAHGRTSLVRPSSIRATIL